MVSFCQQFRSKFLILVRYIGWFTVWVQKAWAIISPKNQHLTIDWVPLWISDQMESNSFFCSKFYDFNPLNYFREVDMNKRSVDDNFARQACVYGASCYMKVPWNTASRFCLQICKVIFKETFPAGSWTPVQVPTPRGRHSPRHACFKWLSSSIMAVQHWDRGCFERRHGTWCNSTESSWPVWIWHLNGHIPTR